MRIQCTQCDRQHDFAGRPPGTKAYCRCGAALALPEPATPPRTSGCPQCGGQIDLNKGECLHCGSQHAAVSCPSCFAVAFAGDRHCAGCGSSLAAPARRVHRNGHMAMPCPRCEDDLKVVLLDDVAVDGCDRCGGLFLDQRAMVKMLRQRERFKRVASNLDGAGGARSAASLQTAHCPECDGEMRQRRHRNVKKLVIDVCDDHGIWLDGNELAQILRAKGGERALGVSRKRVKRGRRGEFEPDDVGREIFAGFFWFHVIDGLIELIGDVLDGLDIDIDL